MDEKADRKERNVKSKDFWTFVPTRLEVRPTIYQTPIVTVEGYFLFVKFMVKGLIRDFVPHYLTPEDAPFRLVLPRWFFGSGDSEIPVDRVTMRDVTLQMAKLFGTPFMKAPAAPFDISWHRIPPSKREKAKRAAEKARLSELMEKSPEEELEEES